MGNFESMVTFEGRLDAVEASLAHGRVMLWAIAAQMGRNARLVEALRFEGSEAGRGTACRRDDGERGDLAAGATPPVETPCSTVLRFLRDPQTAPATAEAAAEQGAELGETPLTTALRLVRASRVAPAAAGPQPKQAARMT